MTNEVAETPEHMLTRFAQEITTRVERDPDEIRKEIALRILEANTPEEALGPQGTLGLRENIGKVFLITSVEWRDSDKPGAYLDTFAIVHAKTESGREVVLSTGSFQVMLGLWKFADAGWLPATFRVCQQEKQSTDGNKAMWLELVPSF